MNQKERHINKLPSTVFLILAVLMFIFQLFVVLAGQKFEIHYLNDPYFYFLNMLIIIFACFGILPFIVKKRLLLMIASFLLLTQFGVSFLGNNHQMIASTSPKKQNVLLIRSDKKSGTAYYQQNINERFPQIAKWLPRPSAKNNYLLFGSNEVQLTYPVTDNYQVTWPNEDVGVLTYVTPDGAVAQFVRTYHNWALSDGKERTQLVEAIGDWQGTNSSLDATGRKYVLKIANKTIQLDPTYQTMVADSVAIFKDAQGVALATIVYDPTSRELLIVPADTGNSQVVHLRRV